MADYEELIYRWKENGLDNMMHVLQCTTQSSYDWQIFHGTPESDTAKLNFMEMTRMWFHANMPITIK